MIISIVWAHKPHAHTHTTLTSSHSLYIKQPSKETNKKKVYGFILGSWIHCE